MKGPQSSTPPAKKQAPLTTRSSSLRCVSAAEHHTADQYSKIVRTKPRKHPPRSNLSWNTRHYFLKIPSLWEAALETGLRWFSKVVLESNVTPKISRSADSCSTVPPIVNEGDWGYIVRDLETILDYLIWSQFSRKHNYKKKYWLINGKLSETKYDLIIEKYA